MDECAQIEVFAKKLRKILKILDLKKNSSKRIQKIGSDNLIFEDLYCPLLILQVCIIFLFYDGAGAGRIKFIYAKLI